jgi:hypothetical protein
MIVLMATVEHFGEDTHGRDGQRSRYQFDIFLLTIDFKYSDSFVLEA